MEKFFLFRHAMEENLITQTKFLKDKSMNKKPINGGESDELSLNSEKK